jgi:hypothetical protein
MKTLFTFTALVIGMIAAAQFNVKSRTACFLQYNTTTKDLEEKSRKEVTNYINLKGLDLTVVCPMCTDQKKFLFTPSQKS